MIFSIPLNTRGTECGPDRWVTLPSIISYMEHCRWLWMDVPELGLVDAVHQGHGFYVVSQSIAMVRRFGMGQSASVRCVLTHAGRSVADGIQQVVRDDGVTLAHCRIRGAWMAPSGRLARIPNATREAVFTGDLPVHRGTAHVGSTTSLFDPPGPLRPGTLDLTLPEHRPAEPHRFGITVRASDIDVIWTSGYGFPRHRGGPMHYADSIGVDRVYATLSEYRERFGPTYWDVPELLRELATSGRRFADL